MMFLLLNWVLWLIIAALTLRWVIGGTIDCFKKGSKAPLLSWMGFVVGIVIFIIICAAAN